MEKKVIDEMLLTQKMKLSKLKLLWHYSLVILLFLPTLFVVWNFLEYYVLGIKEGMKPDLGGAVGIICIMFTLIFFYIQRKRLEFKEFKVNGLTQRAFMSAYKQTAKELNWSAEVMKDNIIIAHRYASWEFSVGELITIIMDGDRILINSICDPDRAISAISYGWNKRNIKTFIKNINRATME